MVEFGRISNAYYNCHSDISIVVYTLLSINNVAVFKLSILKQHRFIISYSNRLPAMSASILMFFYLLLAKQSN
jgi:hypothetical protein